MVTNLKMTKSFEPGSSVKTLDFSTLFSGPNLDGTILYKIQGLNCQQITQIYTTPLIQFRMVYVVIAYVAITHSGG